VRAGLSVSVITVLVAALLTGGREPSVDRLATASVPPADAGPATPAPALPPVHLPDPTGRAVHAPASSSSSKLAPLTSLPNAQGIPSVALEAYQRSAVVIDSADPTCKLDWSLLAAIGQVESDHGQVGGSHLDRNGVARPGIVGPRLDGRHGTSLVRDTDAGRLDGDKRFDRAVGPMQFLPSTWAAVAVDGDADGRRDVQDIDDASLGSAVYLCADHGDLGTRGGRQAALLRYNHSQAYATRVMAIARDYRSSDLQAPVGDLNVRPLTAGHRGKGHRHHHRGRHHGRHHRHHATIDPTSPGQGTNDPTLPTSGPSPTTPGNPGDPTTPGNPGDPTTPGNPGDPTTPGDPGDPTTPGDPGDPTQPPVLPDPLPTELSDLTPDQVQAYDAAWATCDDDLTAGWSADPDIVATLTQCLSDQIGVPVDDPDLVAFVGWLARTEDASTE
jgi:hypothetical protein